MVSLSILYLHNQKPEMASMTYNPNLTFNLAVLNNMASQMSTAVKDAEYDEYVHLAKKLLEIAETARASTYKTGRPSSIVA